ncbi:hypothetical protein ABE484_14335, partial [Pseudomonas pudica]
TPLRVSLTVGEYMSLLNEALEARTDAFLQQVDKQFRDPLGRKVRAMVLSGAINIAAAGNRSQMIEVMLWTLESAESLQARLVQLREGAVAGVGALVRNVAIGAGTLRAQGSDGLKISSIAAQNMASDAMRSMRDAATSTGSVGLLLTLGSIWFQQDSLGKNYRALHETNTSNPEALATIWSSSLGVLGASVETAGFTIALVRPNPEWPGTITNSSLASKLARYGGAITAMAGLMDGAQYAFATFRTIENGDNTASSKYRIASATAFLSTFSGVAVAFGKAALLGPLGITIVLVLATYTLATIAKRKESTPTELWSRRCRWGIPTAQRAWSEAEHLDAAIGALNAATLGVQADARVNLSLASNAHLDTAAPEGTIISDGHAVPAVFMLDFHFTLPNYQTNRSYYRWELNLYQSGLHENTITLSGESAPNSVLTIAQPSDVNIFPLGNDKQHQSRFDSERGVFTTQYSLPLHDNHHIRDIKFILDYRPNKNDDAGNARLEIKENKIKIKDL